MLCQKLSSVEVKQARASVIKNLLSGSVTFIHGLTLFHLICPARPNLNLMKPGRKKSRYHHKPKYYPKNLKMPQLPITIHQQRAPNNSPPQFLLLRVPCMLNRHQDPKTRSGSGSYPSPHALSSLQNLRITKAPKWHF